MNKTLLSHILKKGFWIGSLLCAFQISSLAGSLEYPLTLINCSAEHDSYPAGEPVTITANPAPKGQDFNYWLVYPDTEIYGLPTTTIIMQAPGMKVEAKYKPISPAQKYTLTIQYKDTHENVLQSQVVLHYSEG